MELPDIPALAKRLGGRRLEVGRSAYPECLADLDAGAACARWARNISSGRRIQRKTDRPYFIDKMPNNWAHVGLIHLILPNARIIDARRHPLACGFSNFKQHFARGQGFTYDLAELGRLLSRLCQADAPFRRGPAGPGPPRHPRAAGRGSRSARSGACSTISASPFDPACLRFHENARAVRTASSEQVRRPINREGLDQWRPFEPWLGPLKEALGPVLDLSGTPVAR